MKKVFSFVLVTICITLICLTVGGFKEAEAATKVASGSCGKSATWSLNDDGVLTISGSGNMYNWISSEPGWAKYNEQIEEIVIKSGVKSVGKNAFHVDYPSVTKVSLPSTVTSIGDYAFDGCWASLKSVNFPSALESIGDHAFDFCGALQISVNLPAGLKEIGECAFRLSGIKTLTIPSGVENIGFAAFENCDRLTEASIGEGSGNLVVSEGAFCGCNELETVKIGEAVTKLGSSAFAQCPDLEEIYFYGNAPQFVDSTVFTWCESTAYVPANNATWTSAKMKDYGGDIKWVKSSSFAYQAPKISGGNNAVTGKPTLSWAKMSGASKYEVWRATSKNGAYTKMYTQSSASYTNTSAVAGNTYYYKVCAVNSSGVKSRFSNVVTIACDCEAPVAKLTITASSGKPSLTWNTVSGASKYEVYRATSKNGTYTKMYTTENTSYTNTSAYVGYTYYYKVKAICEKTSYGNSAFSEIKMITCDCARPVVSISLNSKGKPRLTWDAVSGASKYEIYRSTDKSGTYTKVYTTTNTSYTNTGAKAGTTYYYKVKAICGRSSYGNSAYSYIDSIRSK